MKGEAESGFLRRMPKVELHLHLEGSIQPATAFDLMRRNQAGHVPQSSAEIRQLYRFEDLGQFVLAMRSVSNHIVRLEDLQRVTSELLDELIGQNVRYVEFDCALQKYIDLGFSLEEILEVLQSSVQAFDSRIRARLIVNLQRSHGGAKTAALVERVAALNHPLVVGVGLSGDEARYPQSEFIAAFAAAREAGLHRTVHAGEARGPESVREALDLLHAERIDHGTRAIEDAELVDRLLAEQIPLTQCLSSNLRLSVVPGIENHPFPLFLRRGMIVALHTDDPQIFNITLTDEYDLAMSSFGLDRAEMRQIALNGVLGSFLGEREKESLGREIGEAWAKG